MRPTQQKISNQAFCALPKIFSQNRGLYYVALYFKETKISGDILRGVTDSIMKLKYLELVSICVGACKNLTDEDLLYFLNLRGHPNHPTVYGPLY